MDTDPYDRFTYDSLPYAVTHPDWLHTVGRLHGLHPAPAERCRVLELGCGTGGNLLPLAELLPDSEFVGIDQAPGQIATARATATALGLSNLHPDACDVRDLPAALGSFDYVVCHGVYSWVPGEVREAILRAMRRHLAPHGVAYLSFNTLPGWHPRGALRGLLRRLVPSGPPEQMTAAARRILPQLHAHLQTPGLDDWLRGEIDLLGRFSDGYLFFEHLVEVNDPCYLEDLVHDAQRAGLAYLGDADDNRPAASRLGSIGEALLGARAQDRVAAEQLIDLLTLRTFRRTLLCRGPRSPAPTTDPAALMGAWVGSDLSEDAEDADRTEQTAADADAGRPCGVGPDMPAGAAARFTGPDERVVTTQDPISAAVLRVLVAAAPAGVAVRDLPGAVARHLDVEVDAVLAREVGERVLSLVLRGELAAGFWPRPVAASLPDHPVAPRMVRLQARQERAAVTSVRHTSVAVDTLERVLLENLDGQTARTALRPVVEAAQASGRLVMTIEDEPVTDPDLLDALIAAKLERLRLCGLILAPHAEPIGRRALRETPQGAGPDAPRAPRRGSSAPGTDVPYPPM